MAEQPNNAKDKLDLILSAIESKLYFFEILYDGEIRTTMVLGRYNDVSTNNILVCAIDFGNLSPSDRQKLIKEIVNIAKRQTVKERFDYIKSRFDRKFIDKYYRTFDQTKIESEKKITIKDALLYKKQKLHTTDKKSLDATGLEISKSYKQTSETLQKDAEETQKEAEDREDAKSTVVADKAKESIKKAEEETAQKNKEARDVLKVVEKATKQGNIERKKDEENSVKSIEKSLDKLKPELKTESIAIGKIIKSRFKKQEKDKFDLIIEEAILDKNLSWSSQRQYIYYHNPLTINTYIKQLGGTILSYSKGRYATICHNIKIKKDNIVVDLLDDYNDIFKLTGWSPDNCIVFTYDGSNLNTINSNSNALEVYKSKNLPIIKILLKSIVGLK